MSRLAKITRIVVLLTALPAIASATAWVAPRTSFESDVRPILTGRAVTTLTAGKLVPERRQLRVSSCRNTLHFAA